jgi:hypothetical protein
LNEPATNLSPYFSVQKDGNGETFSSASSTGCGKKMNEKRNKIKTGVMCRAGKKASRKKAEKKREKMMKMMIRKRGEKNKFF